MKIKKILGTAALFLAAALLPAACSGGENIPVTETAAPSVTSAEISETVTETVTTAETSPKVTEAAEEEPAVNEIEYAEVSLYNKFIDFEITENYQGTADIGELADKAVEFLKTTEEYAESTENISEFSGEEFADFIKNGEIVPKFNIAYPADYDGDGETETFIVADMPVYNAESGGAAVRGFVMLASPGDFFSLLDAYDPREYVSLINYGKFKHIVFYCGNSPYGGIAYIYDARNYRPAEPLFSGQYGLDKRGCFLYAHGFQATERFMYFDTSRREYCQIAAEQVSHEELKSLDKTGSLDGVFAEFGGNFSAWVMGGKYYCIKVMFEFAKVYSYENGTFTLMENPPVALNICESDMPAVKDIDIDEALSNMKKPFVQVSNGNEFIDYEFIENYQGTSDIGELADKAVEYLKTTDFYARSLENIALFTEEEFAPYIEGGVIVPKFNTAYPNDYDGDGETETFIIIKMPYSPPYLMDGITAIRDFVIFADKDGNMEVINETSDLYPVQLMNYGKFKHIAIGGEGLAGVEAHTTLYGVKDGKLARLYSDRCGFAKEDCFLTVYGWQGRRDFMYFDTVLREYVVIDGVDVSAEDIRAMDKTNALAERLDYDGVLEIKLIGGKYYCMVQSYIDWGSVYTYDGESFTLVENSNAVTSLNLCELKEVIDIDIDKAIAEMKSVK